MPPIRTGTLGGSQGDPAVELAAEALFAIVWDVLSELLGTAAVAAIVRRAVARLAVERPELADVFVFQENLDYRYTLPPAWSQTAGGGPEALNLLVPEIGRLLRELTGNLVISRLEQLPVLRDRGFAWRTEEAN